MNVMDLMPLFGTITDYVENVSRPSKRLPETKSFRKVTVKQLQEWQRNQRAAAFARHHLRNPVSRKRYEAEANKQNLPNAYIAAVTDYLTRVKATID
jgi:CHAD domain-containing protein